MAIFSITSYTKTRIGGYMRDTVSKNSSNRKNRFIPNMNNFEVSLSYEGLTLKKSNERLSIADLKRKYAR